MSSDMLNATTCPVRFVLLCTPQRGIPALSGGLHDEWKAAIRQHFTLHGIPSPFEVVEGRFGEPGIGLDDMECDCVVSPANSFGIMDGGFDLALSRHLHVSPFATGDNAHKQWGLTNYVQEHLKKNWNGYIPPGNCMILSLPSPPAQQPHRTADDRSAQHRKDTKRHIYGIHTLAVLPTMRVPQDVSWHKDLAYNALWALMGAVERWNRDAVQDRMPDVSLKALNVSLDTDDAPGLERDSIGIEYGHPRFSQPSSSTLAPAWSVPSSVYGEEAQGHDSVRAINKSKDQSHHRPFATPQPPCQGIEGLNSNAQHVDSAPIDASSVKRTYTSNSDSHTQWGSNTLDTPIRVQTRQVVIANSGSQDEKRRSEIKMQDEEPGEDLEQLQVAGANTEIKSHPSLSFGNDGYDVSAHSVRRDIDVPRHAALQATYGRDEVSIASKKRPIRRILITGLGTGTGNIPARICAQQMVLAVKHFYYGSMGEHPRWDDESMGSREAEIESAITN